MYKPFQYGTVQCTIVAGRVQAARTAAFRGPHFGQRTVRYNSTGRRTGGRI
jgi:hypothetical protein